VKNAAILVALVFSVLVVAPAVAQVQTLAVSTTAVKPVADGVVTTGEYAASLVVGKTYLAVARTADSLTVALSADTQGWVAIGFGSSRMDKSTIFIGYVKDGKLELRTDLGRGQAHAPTPFDALLASAAKEANGRTTIELALKPAAFLAQGQKEIAIIVAYGNSDSFISPHAARWSGVIKLAD
jgi:hypothetical protein